MVRDFSYSINEISWCTGVFTSTVKDSEFNSVFGEVNNADGQNDSSLSSDLSCKFRNNYWQKEDTFDR